MLLRMGRTKRTVLDGVFVFDDEERQRFSAKQSCELRSQPLQRQCTGLREGASGRDWKSNPQLEHPLCFLSGQRQWFSQGKSELRFFHGPTKHSPMALCLHETSFPWPKRYVEIEDYRSGLSFQAAL